MVNFKKLNLIVLLGTAIIGSQIPCAYGMDRLESDDSEKLSCPPNASPPPVNDESQQQAASQWWANTMIEVPSLDTDLSEPNPLDRMFNFLNINSDSPDASPPPPATLPIYAFDIPKENRDLWIQRNTVSQTTPLNQILAPVSY